MVRLQVFMNNRCNECARLEEVIAEKTQARVVAENALTLLGAGQFASASKNLESAFRDWMNASMAYQEHMRTHEGRSRAH